MRLHVVIPTWRRPAELARCLDGLAGQTRAPDAVTVVARAEDADTRALVARPRADGPAVDLVEVEGTGVVRALRAGFDAREADVVAVTDDDAVPHPDWLERIEAALRSDAGAGGVGGRDHVHRDGVRQEGEAREVGRVRAFGRVVGNHHLGTGEAREVDVLKGVNMAFRREALAGVEFGAGLCGEGAQVHWELDLCLAVRARGWRLLYDPRIAVDHHPAERHDEDRREGRPLTALAGEVYNEQLVLARRLPPRRAVAAAAYGLVVGTRHAPGLVTALEGALRGRPAWRELAACERARVAALRRVLL